MPPFEPPLSPSKKNDAWFATAKPGFRDPRKLWTDYWQRFNTITIPLLDEDAYFADALEAARRAHSRDHLEQLLAEKSDERCRNLKDVLSEVSTHSTWSRVQFASEKARYAAMKAGKTGSLDSFLQVVCGVVYGWEGHGDGEARLLEAGAGDAADTDTRGEEDAGVSRLLDDDAEDVGGDPYEHINQQPHVRRCWEDWASDEEEAFNVAAGQRVTDCGDVLQLAIDPNKAAKQLPVDGQGLTTVEDGRRSEETSIPDRQATTVGDGRWREETSIPAEGQRPATPDTDDPSSARTLSSESLGPSCTETPPRARPGQPPLEPTTDPCGESPPEGDRRCGSLSTLYGSKRRRRDSLHEAEDRDQSRESRHRKRRVTDDGALRPSELNSTL